MAYAKAAFRNDDEGHTGSAVVQYVSGRRLVVVQSVKRRIKLIIMLSFSGLLPKQRVDLLFYPVFVVRSVSPSRLLEHQAAQIRQLIDKVEKLTDVISDGWAVGVQPLQVFFEYLANAFHALIDRLEVAVCTGFRLL